MEQQISRRCAGTLGWPSAAAHRPKAEWTASDIALHRDGGYSFSEDVRHCPKLFLPIDCPLGSSVRTRLACRWCIIDGKLTQRNSVGLTVLAPRRPCAKRIRSTPGNWQITCMIGKRQMEAASSRSTGSAGCSAIPTVPARATSIMASSVKISRLLPIKIWDNSLSPKDGRPHSSESVLRTRGSPLPIAWTSRSSSSPCAGWSAPLTRDHVSQGGPAMKPTT